MPPDASSPTVAVDCPVVGSRSPGTGGASGGPVILDPQASDVTGSAPGQTPTTVWPPVFGPEAPPTAMSAPAGAKAEALLNRAADPAGKGAPVAHRAGTRAATDAHIAAQEDLPAIPSSCASEAGEDEGATSGPAHRPGGQAPQDHACLSVHVQGAEQPGAGMTYTAAPSGLPPPVADGSGPLGPRAPSSHRRSHKGKAWGQSPHTDTSVDDQRTASPGTASGDMASPDWGDDDGQSRGTDSDADDDLARLDSLMEQLQDMVNEARLWPYQCGASHTASV